MAERSRSWPSAKADLRWALATVPAMLLLGLASAKLGEPAFGDSWFDQLAKPAAMPPQWAFPAISSISYILAGIALAFVLSSGQGRARQVAVLLFLVQLGFHLAWPPVFLAQHRIMLGFGLLLAAFLWAGIATIVFRHIRRAAAWLMLPYLAWLLFAGWQNWQVHKLNPYGVTLVPSTGDTQIVIQ